MSPEPIEFLDSDEQEQVIAQLQSQLDSSQQCSRLVFGLLSCASCLVFLCSGYFSAQVAQGNVFVLCLSSGIGSLACILLACFCLGFGDKRIILGSVFASILSGLLSGVFSAFPQEQGFNYTIMFLGFVPSILYWGLTQVFDEHGQSCLQIDSLKTLQYNYKSL